MHLLSRQKVDGRQCTKLKEIIELIRKGATTKKHIMDYLGWGSVELSGLHIVDALMNHPNIYDVMDDYPTYVWIDSINQ